MHLTQDGEKDFKKGGNNYTEIIAKFYPVSGRGLSMKMHKHNFVYCDDPAKLD